jgi:molybdopterin molybdotransferase
MLFHAPILSLGDDGRMRSIAEHQLAVRQLLAGLSSRDPELWDGALPPIAGPYRILARDLVSDIDLPPFDNSQMDGYAVAAEDVRPGSPMPVAPRIPAGTTTGTLARGTAAPIMTGAPLPANADAVIPIEESTPDRFQPEDDGRTVEFGAAVTQGTFVRRRGSDLAAGSLLLSGGTRLGPAQWGVIAAAGVTEVPLLPRVRILVLSTGDELVPRDAPLTPGRIHDANSSSLAVALASSGAEVTASRVVSDDADALRAILAEHLADVDLVLTTGGVSQGAYEVVRDVFEGVGVDFVDLAMQPGGPQGLGLARIAGLEIPVVAFPGNPVSALVSFEMFLRPVLRELHGLGAYRPAWEAPLKSSLDSPSAKHQVRRGRITETGEVELIGGASSHLLFHYAASSILAHVPAGISHLEPGDRVTVWSIDD